MAVATSRVEVGVRDLKNNLSRYLDRVKDGEEVIVTDRGQAGGSAVGYGSFDRPSGRADRRGSGSSAEEHDPVSSGATHQAQGLGERPRRRTAALITYVDTSSLLKLLIEESGSEQAGHAVGHGRLVGFGRAGRGRGTGRSCCSRARCSTHPARARRSQGRARRSSSTSCPSWRSRMA